MGPGSFRSTVGMSMETILCTTLAGTHSQTPNTKHQTVNTKTRYLETEKLNLEEKKFRL